MAAIVWQTSIVGTWELLSREEVTSGDSGERIRSWAATPSRISCMTPPATSQCSSWRGIAAWRRATAVRYGLGQPPSPARDMTRTSGGIQSASMER